MGGYAAWVAARGAEPDRRLVTLGVSFDDGSAWPTLLDFGGVPVVADGGAELSFAIDCGAKVSFSLTSGRLGSVTVTATDPPTRFGEGTTTIESHVIQKMLNFPHERSVGDVWLHLDSPRFGWLCRTANVSVEPSWLPHFFPGDSAELTASVTNCHPNAYLGCTWTGGEGIQFSDPNSLSTTVTYDSTSTVEWATNGIDLITQFVGYTLTNDISYTESYTVYMSCPNLGTGTITAAFTPSGDGDPQTNSVTFRCIEPLRRLVNSGGDLVLPEIFNPSRLVYGTNAALCVDCNGPFQENEIHWRVKEGPARIEPEVGRRVIVTPAATDGVVVVEARFNDDEIQPMFVLPIVHERVLDVRAFVVCKETGRKKLRQ